MSRRAHQRPARRLWRWPLATGAGSAIGLASALVGDGAYDALSWMLLSVPIVVTLVALRPGRG
jgi:hypothetical protein